MSDKPKRIFSPPDCRCEKCDLPLAFKQTKTGAWCPCNPDGSDHFDICRLTQFVNADRPVCVGMLTLITKANGKWPKIPDDGLPPWDESIVPDWSWVRYYDIVPAKNPYHKWVNPQELLDLIQSS